MNIKKELTALIDQAKAGKDGEEAQTLKMLVGDLQALVDKLVKDEKIAKLKSRLAELEKA